MRDIGLPVTSGLVLALVPALGSILDYSGASRHPTIAGSGMKWARANGVDQLVAESTGRLVVANDATLQAVTDNSLFVASDSPDSADSWRILSKRDAGGQCVDIHQTGGTVRIYDGVSTPSVAISWGGVKSWCVTIPAAAKASMYLNGAFESLFNIASVVTADNADVTLLSDYTGVKQFNRSVRALLWYSRVLEAWENSLLHAWSRSLASPRIAFDRRYFDQAPQVPNGDEGGVVASYDFGTVTRRETPDFSGGGHHASLAGKLYVVNTEAGRALRCIDGVDAADAGSITGDDDVTIEAVLLGRTPGGGGAGRLLTIAGNIVLAAFGNPLTSMAVILSGVTGSTFSVPGVLANNWFHFVFTRRKSDGAVRGYINGVETLSTTGGTQALPYSGTLVLFNNAVSGGIRAMDGDAKNLIIRNRFMEAAEVKAKYAEFASRVMWDSGDMGRVTLVGVTSGPLGTSGMDVITGIWAVSEDATGKHYECVSAGKIRAPLPNAGNFHTDAFVETGTATLTKNATNIEIDAGAGDIIRTVRLTLGAV